MDHMDKPPPLVIFTDLDGTLLDHHTYSHQKALPALAALKARGIPLVLCSSKTSSEMQLLWRELGLDSPFIAENGGGVFAPKGHFLTDSQVWEPAADGWAVLALGLPIAEVRRRFEGFKDRLGALGFGDMSDARVAELTGLNLAAAARARRREFNEPVLLSQPEAMGREFMQAAREAGLEATRGGRFFHLLGGGDKGKAVNLLISLYRKRWPALAAAALGDALNDEPMLAQVDHPILVARPDGGHARIDAPGLVKTPLPGPQGWNQAVLELIGQRTT